MQFQWKTNLTRSRKKGGATEACKRADLRWKRSNNWATNAVVIDGKVKAIRERIMEHHCDLYTMLSWDKEGEQHQLQTCPCRTNKESSSSESGAFAKQTLEEVMHSLEGEHPESSLAFQPKHKKNRGRPR